MSFSHNALIALSKELLALHEQLERSKARDAMPDADLGTQGRKFYDADQHQFCLMKIIDVTKRLQRKVHPNTKALKDLFSKE